MKFLIIGLGSMGKRRIRNLHALDEKAIIGFDLSDERRKESEEKYGVKTVGDLAELNSSDYDALIISTPPNVHAPYIRKALAEKKHFFVEVTTSSEGYEEILAQPNDGVIRAPSHTFRYFKPIQKMRELLHAERIGTVLAYQYHMGQYLPDWHPWEDYRQVYFAKRETSAIREMFPYELIWLSQLIGARVAEVTGFVDRVSDLDMDADDILMTSLRHQNGVYGNIVIDVLSRKPFRTLRLIGTTGVIEWEWQDWKIRCYDSATKQTETIEIEMGKTEAGYINVEDMYIDEIRAFLDAIHGRREYPYSFTEDLHHLKTLYALEEASRTKRTTAV